MAEPPRRTTIIDVAKLAGVSSKSVSRVLNDAPNVTPELRQRVLDATEALNFHPNTFAQGLVRQRSHLIGLIYENPSPSYVVELQMGVLDTLKGSRYRLVVLPVQSVEQRAHEIVGLMRSAGLDGAVLAPPASDHPIVLKQLDAAHMRYARISPTRHVEQGLSHLIDDVAAAREIAAHIIGLGHRRIGIVQGDPTHPATQARMTGYALAFADAGLYIEDRRIEHGMFTFESGYEAGKRMFANSDRPSALLVQNDEMAVGAMTAAREACIRIPEELSVAGFDDSEVARIVWPRLTTIRQPIFEMAAAATEMLIARLEGESGDRLVHHDHQLIVRESSARPAGG